MMDKNALYQNLNEGVLDERFKTFERNLQKNTYVIKQAGGLCDIVGDFQGKYVVVIGAGPSLEKHYDILRKYQHRQELKLIAADMALVPLIRQGIKPGYVFSCETNPVDFFSSVRTDDIRLIAFSCVSHSNIRKWQGPISFYNWMLDDHRYSGLWEKAGLHLGSVATASIITTQAIAFALGCDIRALAMAGNDLGFRRRFYIRGSVPYSRVMHTFNRFRNIDSFDYGVTRRAREYQLSRGSELYYTNRQFLAAKMWLEDLFPMQKIPIYDCSIPGCSEKCVIKSDLADFISLFDPRCRKRVGRKK